MHKPIIIFLFSLFTGFAAEAQELNCKVVVNADRVQTTEKRVFKDMETAFSQFLNTTKWTNNTYKNHEKINCNVIITIEESGSIGNYKAAVQIQSARPVFSSSYESLVFNFADRDWQFQYVESNPLDFNVNSFSDNLTSMLGYYAYIIIGLDSDSFEKLGGSRYFEFAQNIVTNAQQAPNAGWKQFENNRNRFWLSENLMNQQMVPVREGYYNYHRLGMDIFDTKPDEARKAILETLKSLKKVNAIRPNSILVITFLDAKSDELASLFSQGDMQVRREAYTILSELDPSKLAKYASIIAN